MEQSTIIQQIVECIAINFGKKSQLNSKDDVEEEEEENITAIVRLKWQTQDKTSVDFSCKIASALSVLWVFRTEYWTIWVTMSRLAVLQKDDGQWKLRAGPKTFFYFGELCVYSRFVSSQTENSVLLFFFFDRQRN